MSGHLVDCHLYFLNFEIKKVHLAGKIRKGLREDECWRIETQEGAQQVQKQRPEVTMQVQRNACNFAGVVQEGENEVGAGP